MTRKVTLSNTMIIVKDTRMCLKVLYVDLGPAYSLVACIGPPKKWSKLFSNGSIRPARWFWQPMVERSGVGGRKVGRRRMRLQGIIGELPAHHAVIRCVGSRYQIFRNDFWILLIASVSIWSCGIVFHLASKIEINSRRSDKQVEWLKRYIILLILQTRRKSQPERLDFEQGVWEKFEQASGWKMRMWQEKNSRTKKVAWGRDHMQAEHPQWPEPTTL